MFYCFFLGREPLLSFAEISAVFQSQKINYKVTDFVVNKQWLFIEADNSLPIHWLMDRLGGTIKIAELVEEADGSVDSIVAYLLKTIPDGKVEFSVVCEGNKNFGLEVKKLGKENKVNFRYIEAKNTATILHNNLVKKQSDLMVVGKKVFVTRAIQPIEEFGERDYGRPGRDAKSGMLPPKLARLMVNLAGADENSMLYDPFCGSGTILTEAADIGYDNLVGSDLSKEAVKATETNLRWLTEKADKKINTNIFAADVRQLPKEKFRSIKINFIVTEPYLGRPRYGKETETQLQRQATELAQLYKGALVSFSSILSSGSTVIMAIPRFRFMNSWIRIPFANLLVGSNFKIDPLLPDEPTILYARKTQWVGREIWRLKKV